MSTTAITLLAATAATESPTALWIRITVGAGIIIVAWLIAKGITRFGAPLLASRRTESFGTVVAKLIGYLVVIASVLVAAVVIFPSFKPVDVLSGLGIFSIAIGFAFQDILSNLLAGILLLIRQPFHAGDEIEVSGQHGTVEQITIRETQIRTYDGEKVLIPNAEVYQNVIRVQTAYGPKRTTLVIGLDDWEDLDRAADVALGAIRDIDGVEADPPPQAYFNSFGDSVTNMDLRFWTQPQQAEVRRVQDQVVRLVGRALKEAKIPMPSPITELDVRASVKDLLSDIAGRSTAKPEPSDNASDNNDSEADG
ncbi:MAG: mechanosensitive ion channel family protein [Ilumatobacteraceae bacterium]